MKKILLPLLILIGYDLIQPQSVTIISPNGGESWTLGSTHVVTWNFSGIPGNTLVKLVLFKDGNKIGNIVQNVSIGSSGAGSFNWKVGDYEGGTAAAGSGYKIRIRDMNGTYPPGEGAGGFTIVALPPPPPPPTPSITVKSPNGGEQWGLGSTHTVTWTAVNISGKVQLELVRYQGQMLGIIADNLVANTGSYTWKAGEYPGNTAPAGQYLIRVRSMAKPEIFDESDQPFALDFIHAGPFHDGLAQKTTVTRKPQITNWQGTDSFGTSNPVPPAAWQGRPKCDAASNTLAEVGAEWFAYDYYRVGVLYRSRLVFSLSDLKEKAADLRDAKLKLRQVSQVRSGQNNDASCARRVCVLLGPWNSFNDIQIDCIASPGTWETEYTVDVTATVRKWIDGSLVNHGFLLFGAEAPTSKNFACFSCYEVSLILTMK
jgi:hypothetical protein